MIKNILQQYEDADFDEKVRIYNMISQELYDFLRLNHPVLNVQLVPLKDVKGNDYNPNKVAPPEMRLLELSIMKDGLTMPVVVSEKKANKWVIVDGFHRMSICRDTKTISAGLNNYLPVSYIDKKVEERVASTVRHNMARGTHQVELTAKLVTLLKKNEWSNKRIGDELGMDPDEVLRLRQITGLAEAFRDEDFSQSWKL